jgi:hypothetical protein
MFFTTRYRDAMSAPPPQLEPADRDTLLMLLAYALGFTLAGKARRGMDDARRQIEAAELLEHMERSGFVVMRRWHSKD